MWNTGQTCFTCWADWWIGQDLFLKPIWGKIALAPQPVFAPGDSPYSMIGGSGFIVPAKAKRPDLGALFGAFQLLDPRALRKKSYQEILPASQALWPELQPDRRHLFAPSVKEQEMLTMAALHAPATYRYPAWYSRVFPYYGTKVLAVLSGTMGAQDAQQSAYHDVLTKVVQRAQ